MTEKNKRKAELKARRKPPIRYSVKEATKNERVAKSVKKHKNSDKDFYDDLRMEQQEQM